MTALRWSRAALLFGLALAVYTPSFDGGFLHDDDELVVANPVVQRGGRSFGAESWAGLGELWGIGVERPGAHHLPGIPVTATSLWLEWRLFGSGGKAGGVGAPGYRVVNAALHAGCALLLWWVLGLLGAPGAWWAALFWALHPVCVESVAWIAERKNTLSMAFALLSTGAWLRWLESRRLAHWALSLLGCLLALLSKPAVAPLPVVLLLFAAWRRGRLEGATLRAAVPHLALALASGLLAIWAQRTLAFGDEPLVVGSLAERLGGASFALGFYAWKSLWPFGSLAVYPRWHETLPMALQLLPATLALAATLACWRARAGWGRHGLVSILGFGALLAPALGILPMSYLRITLVADHFLYHALPLALAPLTAWAVVAAQRGGPGMRRGLAALGVALAALLAAGTLSHARVFRSEEALWSHTLQRNPDAWLAHSRLGVLRLNEGRPREARELLEQALRTGPELGVVHNNLGSALGALGELGPALRHFRRALALAPSDPLIRLSGALALLQTGHPAEALPHFEAAQAMTLDAHSAELARQGLAEARRRVGAKRQRPSPAPPPNASAESAPPARPRPRSRRPSAGRPGGPRRRCDAAPRPCPRRRPWDRR